jgi:hypothetical protein
VQDKRVLCRVSEFDGHINRKADTLRTSNAMSVQMRGFPMDAKFAIGDKVDQSPRSKFVETIKALFTTKEGETRYVVDVEGHGTLRLCSEHTIVSHH